MGYRSDVVIALYGDELSFAAFMPLLKSESEAYLRGHYEHVDNQTPLDFTLREFMNDLDNARPFTTGSMRGITVRFDNVKWYEGYPHVDAWESVASLVKDFVGMNFELMRVGEELTDIEHSYAGDNISYVLQCSRAIELTP